MGPGRSCVRGSIGVLLVRGCGVVQHRAAGEGYWLAADTDALRWGPFCLARSRGRQLRVVRLQQVLARPVLPRRRAEDGVDVRLRHPLQLLLPALPRALRAPLLPPAAPGAADTLGRS